MTLSYLKKNIYSGFICDQNEYTVVALKELLFDEYVADMVDAQYGKSFPDDLLPNIYSTDTFKLDQVRLNRILGGYTIGIPPIDVIRQLGGKYQVVNGRHRVCATILKGGTTIACRIK